MNHLQQFLDFLERLDTAKIHYSLAYHREEAIMACISVPGERWEVEFFSNGEIEVEVFRSTGAVVESKKQLERLFTEFSD
jgi:hypothetical protein